MLMAFNGTNASRDFRENNAVVSLMSISPIVNKCGQKSEAAVVEEPHYTDGRESTASLSSASGSRIKALQLRIEMEEAAERLHMATIRKISAKMELERFTSESGSQQSWSSNNSLLASNTNEVISVPTSAKGVSSWMSDDLELELSALFSEFETRRSGDQAFDDQIRSETPTVGRLKSQHLEQQSPANKLDRVPVLQGPDETKGIESVKPHKQSADAELQKQHELIAETHQSTEVLLTAAPAAERQHFETTLPLATLSECNRVFQNVIDVNAVSKTMMATQNKQNSSLSSEVLQGAAPAAARQRFETLAPQSFEAECVGVQQNTNDDLNAGRRFLQLTMQQEFSLGQEHAKTKCLVLQSEGVKQVAALTTMMDNVAVADRATKSKSERVFSAPSAQGLRDELDAIPSTGSSSWENTAKSPSIVPQFVLAGTTPITTPMRTAPEGASSSNGAGRGNSEERPPNSERGDSSPARQGPANTGSGGDCGDEGRHGGERGGRRKRENKGNKRGRKHKPPNDPDDDSSSSLSSNSESTTDDDGDEAEHMAIPSLPSVDKMRAFKSIVRAEVVSCSGRGDAAFKWILECESSGATFKSLAKSGRMFMTLDCK